MFSFFSYLPYTFFSSNSECHSFDTPISQNSWWYHHHHHFVIVFHLDVVQLFLQIRCCHFCCQWAQQKKENRKSFHNSNQVILIPNQAMMISYVSQFSTQPQSLSSTVNTRRSTMVVGSASAPQWRLRMKATASFYEGLLPSLWQLGSGSSSSISSTATLSYGLSLTR